MRIIDTTPTLAVVTADDNPESVSVVEQPPSVPTVIWSGIGAQGPQGPPGPAGASASTYEHTQASSSATWTVPHNLGFRPTVSVHTTGGVEVIADVVHLSTNTLQITLTQAMAGTARMN